MKFYPLLSLLQSKLPTTSFSGEDLPSVLFERMIVLERVQQEVSRVSSLPKRKRDAWFKQHHVFLEDLLVDIRREGPSLFREGMLQIESQSKTSEYVVMVQQTLELLENLLGEIKPKS